MIVPKMVKYPLPPTVSLKLTTSTVPESTMVSAWATNLIGPPGAMAVIRPVAESIAYTAVGWVWNHTGGRVPPPFRFSCTGTVKVSPCIR